MYKYKGMIALIDNHHNYTKDYLSNLNLLSEKQIVQQPSPSYSILFLLHLL